MPHDRLDYMAKQIGGFFEYRRDDERAADVWKDGLGHDGNSPDCTLPCQCPQRGQDRSNTEINQQQHDRDQWTHL